MYLLPDMIDYGLLDAQEWPSRYHRVVAAKLGICNAQCFSREKLTEIVQAVIAIPIDVIETVTITDCRNIYNVPYI